MAIQNIFVVGAGLMGSGIAQNAITSGYNVTLNDQRQEALERAKAGIERALGRDVEKGRLSGEDRDAALARLTLDATMEGAKNADLVIEAIFENLEAKQAVFSALEDICPEHTIFASNTSSISLTALAAATKRPARVVGMHFFSPVPRMRLCEVIFGLLTTQDVLDAAKAHAAAQFQADVPGGVLTTWGESYNEETERWEPALLAKAVPFDRVRIKSMEGPYLYTVQAGGEEVETEIWRLICEYHTTEPEFAVNLLAGGMSMDGGGWMNFYGSGLSYLIFTGEGDSRTATPLWIQAEIGSVGFRNAVLDALEAVGLSADERYENADSIYGEDGGMRATDLDRDGVPERVQICDIVADGRAVGQRVELWEGENLLFSEEGYFVHPGYNALFLCKEYGREYLLRYHPTMYQGRCSYSFQLFTLSQTGEEITAREGTVEFDINFQSTLHEKFFPEGIADFMDVVNTLLSGSVQLLNTDEYLADTFEKEGRLYDSLWWLDASSEEGFVRDPAKSLRENLLAFQAAMERQ